MDTQPLVYSTTGVQKFYTLDNVILYATAALAKIGREVALAEMDPVCLVADVLESIGLPKAAVQVILGPYADGIYPAELERLSCSHCEREASALALVEGNPEDGSWRLCCKEHAAAARLCGHLIVGLNGLYEKF